MISPAILKYLTFFMLVICKVLVLHFVTVQTSSFGHTFFVFFVSELARHSPLFLLHCYVQKITIWFLSPSIILLEGYHKFNENKCFVHRKNDIAGHLPLASKLLCCILQESDHWLSLKKCFSCRQRIGFFMFVSLTEQ